MYACMYTSSTVGEANYQRVCMYAPTYIGSTVGEANYQCVCMYAATYTGSTVGDSKLSMCMRHVKLDMHRAKLKAHIYLCACSEQRACHQVKACLMVMRYNIYIYIYIYIYAYAGMHSLRHLRAFEWRYVCTYV